jgi:hypothetical protein
LSSMSSERMNSSASSVMPPSTPPYTAALIGFSSRCSCVRDGLGEVDRELVDETGLRLRPRHGHVNRVRVLLAVEPPALGPHEVVHVVDVELVAREAEAERRVSADDAQFGCDLTMSCIAKAVSKIACVLQVSLRPKLTIAPTWPRAGPGAALDAGRVPHPTSRS